MPRLAAELSAIQIKRITTQGLHSVGGIPGLCLQVSKTGARSWILRVVIGTKRRDIGLGGYPAVTLAKVREKARDFREQISEGRDPILERQEKKQALKKAQLAGLCFADAAKLCHAVKAKEFRNEKHSRQWLSTLEKYAFPVLGDLAVADIDKLEVLAVLEPIWSAKPETASRVRQRIASVFDYADASGHRIRANPAGWKGCLEPLLPKTEKLKKKAGIKHHAALPIDALPRFVGALRLHKGMGAKALEFAILTAARSGEVRHAIWNDIDLVRGLWVIPASKMKAEKIHTVPLSRQATALLNSLERDGDLVFANKKGGVLSDMTLLKATKALHSASITAGQQGFIDPLESRVATPHGIARSTFKDWSLEGGRFPDEWSELALAHINNDQTRAAYARGELLSERAGMMQSWADFADGGEVAAFPGSVEDKL